MHTVTVCTITTGGPCGVCLVLQNSSNRALGFESTAVNTITATDAGTSVSSTNYSSGLGSAGLPDSVSVCIDFTNTAVNTGNSSSSSSRRAYHSSSTAGANNATAAAAAAAAAQQQLQQQSDTITVYIRTKAAAASTSTVLASAQLPRTAVPLGDVTFVRLDSFPPELAPSAPLSSAPLSNPFVSTAAAAPSATLWTFKVYINDADRSSAPALTAAVPLREVRVYAVCMRMCSCYVCCILVRGFLSARAQ
jgi:hypothetical protein